jgi:DNA topoisomerase-3
MQHGMEHPKKGKDQGDHPPITPTDKLPYGVGIDEMRLYDVIARQFLASISKDAKFYKKTV